jgi:hypothetical protein
VVVLVRAVLVLVPAQVVELAVRALAPVVVAPQVAELAQVLAVVLQAARPVAALLLAELVLQQAELALQLGVQQRLVQLQPLLQPQQRWVWWQPLWRL